MLESFLRYKPRSKLMNWLRPLRRDLERAPYSVISVAPPIFYVPYSIDDQLVPMSYLDRLYQYLQHHRTTFLMGWCWQIEEPKKIQAFARAQQTHRQRYPGHRFIHLCNTTRQFQNFRDQGLEAIFCSHNCLVDESIFRPLPEVSKQFDAVYDARFILHKRHALAAQVPRLALIYATDPHIDSPEAIRDVKHLLAHAHFANHPAGGDYRALSATEVNRCLNQSRVGLCLSAVEGAMYASIQYLLAGLPVVTTHSEGGRDVMFDENFVHFAEATPESVAAAVDRLSREAPPPEFIRARTLEKILIHRRRLIELVQKIYDEEGVARNFQAEWPELFFNKLYSAKQSHQETINLFEQSR